MHAFAPHRAGHAHCPGHEPLASPRFSGCLRRLFSATGPRSFRCRVADQCLPTRTRHALCRGHAPFVMPVLSLRRRRRDTHPQQLGPAAKKDDGRVKQGIAARARDKSGSKGHAGGGCTRGLKNHVRVWASLSLGGSQRASLVASLLPPEPGGTSACSRPREPHGKRHWDHEARVPHGYGGNGPWTEKINKGRFVLCWHLGSSRHHPGASGCSGWERALARGRSGAAGASAAAGYQKQDPHSHVQQLPGGGVGGPSGTAGASELAKKKRGSAQDAHTQGRGEQH